MIILTCCIFRGALKKTFGIPVPPKKQMDNLSSDVLQLDARDGNMRSLFLLSGLRSTKTFTHKRVKCHSILCSLISLVRTGRLVCLV